MYFASPVVWLGLASTNSLSELYRSHGWVGLGGEFIRNVGDALAYDDGIYGRWVVNSLIYCLVGAGATTAVSLTAGYAVATYDFRGRRAVLGLAVSSLMIPATALAFPTYRLLMAFGLADSYWGILLPSLVYPFGVLLSYAYALTAVPREVLEAARMDGAGEWRTFRSVAFPMLRSGAVTVMLFAFMVSWNSYLLPLLVLTDQRLFPLTVGLTAWSQVADKLPGMKILALTGSLIAVAPVILVFAMLQRYWQSGLATGAVK
ncbi:MAG: carbohydrate ABC transporter permease [Bifidobacteriaceae bacterium]|nr:carbohydrate ABC transporter permease [Bifidobacteriaceae bacterium]